MSKREPLCQVYDAHRRGCQTCSQRPFTKRLWCRLLQVKAPIDTTPAELILGGMYICWGFFLLYYALFGVLLTRDLNEVFQSIGYDFFAYTIITVNLLHVFLIILPLPHITWIRILRSILCGGGALIWTFCLLLSVITGAEPPVIAVSVMMAGISWWVFLRSGSPN